MLLYFEVKNVKPYNRKIRKAYKIALRENYCKYILIAMVFHLSLNFLICRTSKIKLLGT